MTDFKPIYWPYYNSPTKYTNFNLEYKHLSTEIKSTAHLQTTMTVKNAEHQ